jgi:hypothetical protein
MDGIQMQRLRLVATQGLLHVLCFYLTYLWLFVLQIMESIDIPREDVYVVLVLQAIFSPMAGLFNAIIFFRPQYCFLKSKGEPHVKAMVHAVFPPANGETVEADPELQQSSWRMRRQSKRAPNLVHRLLSIRVHEEAIKTSPKETKESVPGMQDFDDFEVSIDEEEGKPAAWTQEPDQCPGQILCAQPPPGRDEVQAKFISRYTSNNSESLSSIPDSQRTASSTLKEGEEKELATVDTDTVHC